MKKYVSMYLDALLDIALVDIVVVGVKSLNIIIYHQMNGSYGNDVVQG
jgi:hypothetical protein